jgi:hypothetical protein
MRDEAAVLRLVKGWPKRGALVDLGRHFGMFKGKQEGDLSVGVHAMDDEALEAHARQVAARMGITLPLNLLTPKRKLLN